MVCPILFKTETSFQSYKIVFNLLIIFINNKHKYLFGLILMKHQNICFPIPLHKMFTFRADNYILCSGKEYRKQFVGLEALSYRWPRNGFDAFKRHPNLVQI